ncbi:MAG: putative ribosomal N-acetyltransferase YdaF [Mucilaginibacter sp.]|nr:putative ribosomal N-acetyltransferase YdaF [Mucilaginibacter sp.]
MNYNTEIILESERLLFRQHVPEDLEAYCAMEQDPDVRRYVGDRPRTREEAEHRFKGSLKPITNRLAMWATVLKSKGNYIGRCGIYPHFDHDGGIIDGEASLGLYIAADYWGRGFATEAGQAFIKFGFGELKLNRIVTMVQVGNDASVRVLEKLGFVLTETEIGKRSFYHFELKPNKNYN